MIPSLQTDVLACLLVMDFARTHQILGLDIKAILTHCTVYSMCIIPVFIIFQRTPLPREQCKWASIGTSHMLT